VVYYRDSDRQEPVDAFLDELARTNPRAAAKVDAYVEQYLNGRPPSAGPPEYPVTSQVQGQMRELRVRFANTQYRVLYQRSEKLVVLLHAFEKNTRFRRRTAKSPSIASRTSAFAWVLSPGFRHAQPGGMRPAKPARDDLPHLISWKGA
jgi:phage-related protein